MVEKNDGYIVSEEVGTVWGYNDIPRNRRKKEEHQNHFRWFQVSNFWLSNKYVINSSLLITGIQTKYELLNLLWTISDHLLHCLKDSGLGDIYDCWILILFNISMYPVSILVIFLIICVFVSLHLMNLFLYRVFGNEGYTESGSNLIDFYPEIL